MNINNFNTEHENFVWKETRQSKLLQVGSKQSKKHTNDSQAHLAAPSPLPPHPNQADLQAGKYISEVEKNGTVHDPPRWFQFQNNK